MGKHYPNFYETIEEASHRLNHTCVLYDGRPYLVVNIATHQDGIFRVYMKDFSLVAQQGADVYEEGPDFDAYIGTDKAKKRGWLRKHINSPKFNRFRPFPLGFCNFNGNAFYLERTPTRARPQGLTTQGVVQSSISLNTDRDPPIPAPGGRPVMWGTPEMTDTILGNYPTYQACVNELRHPDNTNSSVAFSRDFALLKGPLNLLFVAYKTDAIGLVGREGVQFENKSWHLREAFQEAAPGVGVSRHNVAN